MVDVKRLHGVVFYFYFSVIVLYTFIFLYVLCFYKKLFLKKSYGVSLANPR